MICEVRNAAEESTSHISVGLPEHKLQPIAIPHLLHPQPVCLAAAAPAVTAAAALFDYPQASEAVWQGLAQFLCLYVRECVKCVCVVFGALFGCPQAGTCATPVLCVHVFWSSV